MNSSNFPKLEAGATFEVFHLDLKACTMSSAPMKINENGAFESLNESIGTGNSSRKSGPAVVSYVINVTCQSTFRMA